ncbi:hypothetical protein D3H65_13370 [Paraflavitalea soli]|uniref:DUF4595 domain-containing protein n=1 Tax=Paraflavitalea soli TaxID=2315862 RepID=A0A3B7MMG0_9BACT|nr:hypothetical protein [Paraflavitalea soli]AXY74917.1 hypothetical protein D3H65_13370 [Paraflavitalea soli]
MKKLYDGCLLLGLGYAVIAFTGCNKQEADEEVNLRKDALAIKNECQVSSMTYSFSSEPIGVNIYYNSKGDPISMVQTKPGTGHPNAIFRYDKKRRLTDYIGIYEDGGFEFWHRYVYDKKDRVIHDTSFFFGGMTNDEPEWYMDAAIVKYEYDQKGRIVHTSQDWFSTPGMPLDTYYSYDSKGNLVVPGVVYDDKVCIHRTNKVWMFIDRNYSENNGYATTWHDNGLPASMNLSDQGGQFAGLYFGKLDGISYRCKGDSPF